MNRIWILGAPDPEMEMIEKLLRECGESVAHAHARGARVHPGTAYRGEYVEYVTHCGLAGTPGETWYLVECDLPIPDGAEKVVIDHHRPGDPGYGRPPSEFLEASSIGQVIAELARLGRLPWEPVGCGSYDDPVGCERGSLLPWYPHPGGGRVEDLPLSSAEWQVCIVAPGETGGDWGADPSDWAVVPRELVLVAAADHCLGAAYRGECPGVDPDDLMQWRVETRAAHQGRSVDDVLADVELARRALRDAPMVPCDYSIERWCEGCGPRSMCCSRCYACACGWDESDPYYGFICTWVIDMRRAYTVTTTLVAPFAEGATVDSSGVGDSREVVFGDRDEGAWDEGGHHTSVRRGVPELPEAASREGLAYLATVTDRDGREKVVLGGLTTPEMVREFMEQWAPSEGLVDIYGDPERGFAGGYLP